LELFSLEEKAALLPGGLFLLRSQKVSPPPVPKFLSRQIPRENQFVIAAAMAAFRPFAVRDEG
jgi:hypothetical protein